MIEVNEGPAPIFGESLIDESLISELEMKDPVIDAMVGILRHRGWVADEKEETRIRLCVDEAVVNAMVHGNREDVAKKVRIALMADDRRWGILVEDEGDGFVPEDVPDPDDPESLFLEGGRGILLMRSIMDEVEFYRGGRSVVMIREIEKA